MPAARWALVDHHHAHAALGFYASGLASALVVSVDGGGNDGTTNAYAYPPILSSCHRCFVVVVVVVAVVVLVVVMVAVVVVVGDCGRDGWWWRW